MERRTLASVQRSPAVVDLPGARYVIDYALARRAALTGLMTDRLRREDVCDAHVYLRRAARYHGESTGETCPVCRDDELVHVTYAYGECFNNDTNGRAWATRDLPDLASRLPEFTAHQPTARSTMAGPRSAMRSRTAWSWGRIRIPEP